MTCNKLTIKGVEFDDPREIPLSKRDFGERAEGKRTKVREMWVCSYRREGCAVLMDRHVLEATNHGACSFDGQPVREEREKKLILELFETAKPV